VALLCRYYRVSRSGFYAWRARGQSARSRADSALCKAIKAIHRRSRGSYGSPRVHRALRQAGQRVGAKRVARLMREAHLKGRAARIYRRLARLHKFFERVPNRLRKKKAPLQVNQVWVSDLTYLRLGHSWRYLAAVMDLYSRRIVGWAVGHAKSLALTSRALQRAIELRHPPAGLIVHSDRGVEYAAHGYQRLLEAHGLRASMSRPYTCQDNAAMESFFHSLKTEAIYQRSIGSDAALNAMLAGYIGRFYNDWRLHSSLDYRSPVQFEEDNCSLQGVHKSG
jgi:transposase InsO family protein